MRRAQAAAQETAGAAAPVAQHAGRAAHYPAVSRGMASSVSALDVCAAKAHLQVQELGGGSAYDHLVDVLVAALAQPAGGVRARLEATSQRRR